MDLLLLHTGLAVRFEASFVRAFLVATRTSRAYTDFFEEAFLAKHVAAAVAKNIRSDLQTVAFATNEFDPSQQLPSAQETQKALLQMLQIFTAEVVTTRSHSDSHHQRSRLALFWMRITEHSLFVLFEEHVVSVGREALLEGLDVGEFHFRQDAPGEV